MEVKTRIHVIKRSDGWVVKKEGAIRASRKFSTKAEAVDSTEAYRLTGYDIVVHRADGTIEKWSRKKEYTGAVLQAPKRRKLARRKLKKSTF